MRHVYVLFQFENVELFTFLFLFNKWKCDEFERFSFTMAIIFVLHEKLFRRIVRCAKKWKFVMNLAWKPNCKKCSWKKLNKWKDFTFDAEREPFVPIKWHHDIHFFFKKKKQWNNCSWTKRQTIFLCNSSNVSSCYVSACLFFHFNSEQKITLQKNWRKFIQRKTLRHKLIMHRWWTLQR